MDRLFAVPPTEFGLDSPRDVLATGLGATLYTPATRPQLAAVIRKQAAAGLTSMVLCLEDSVPDQDVPFAIDNLVRAVSRLRSNGKRSAERTSNTGPDGPMIFIRVRDADQIRCVCKRLGDSLQIVTGFVLPKFDQSNGESYLNTLAEVEDEHGHRLLSMPVLESPAFAYSHLRQETLHWTMQTLARHRERILAVRVGATDLSGLYALRRPADMTIYDVRAVAAIIADVISYLGRAGDGFTIAGPVWEYFSARERIFRPRLRQTLFEEHNAAELRRLLISKVQDGLIREVELDKANGILGKTVIHPSHVPVVHSLLVVTFEEYSDASDIAAAAGGGVAASGYGNKMNEAKPHLTWAQRTLTRAGAFGVAKEGVTFVDVLAESVLA